MNELMKTEQVENEISIIEESHKMAILSIHENIEQLIVDCNFIKVDENDKEQYEKAVELKRIVKATHVAVEKKRKEVKQPLIDYGKRLDKWVETIYIPLVKAEKTVKSKIDIYEARQEEIKNERKLEEQNKVAQEQAIENKLKDLNLILFKINSAKSKEELNEITEYLDSVVLSDFGKKSDEAGFILNQLKLTCSMASRLVKDEEEKEEVKPPVMDTTPITDDLINEVRQRVPEQVKTTIIENELDKGLFCQTTNQEVEQNVSDVQENETNQEVEQNVSDVQENETNQEVEQNVSDVQENVQGNQNDTTKASDWDIALIVADISNSLFDDINLLIDDRTTAYINNSQAFNKLDFSENVDLINDAVKKQLAKLLTK